MRIKLLRKPFVAFHLCFHVCRSFTRVEDIWLKKMHFETIWSTSEKRTKVNRDYRASEVIQVKQRKWSTSRIWSHDQEIEKSTFSLGKSTEVNLTHTWSTPKSNPNALQFKISMSSQAHKDNTLDGLRYFGGKLKFKLETIFIDQNIICFLAYGPNIYPMVLKSDPMVPKSVPIVSTHHFVP